MNLTLLPGLAEHRSCLLQTMTAQGLTPNVQGSCQGPDIRALGLPLPWSVLQQPGHHSSRSEK